MKKIRTKLFETVTSRVKETVQRFDPNAEVILFGSRARGDYRKDSDWDFLILMDKQINETFKFEVRSLLFDTELDTEQSISSLIENKNSWDELQITDIYQNIKDEGIAI